MSSLYKTPKAAPLAQTEQPTSAFDKAQRYTSLFLRSGLILIALSIVGGILSSPFNFSLFKDILSASATIGIPLLAFSIFSMIPMSLWGLIQGFTEAKKKK